jgi:tetratricopeptide (TPR) repeat protein
MRRKLLSLSAALTLAVAPAVAFAEEPTKSYPDCGREPTDAEVAAAKGAFQAGNASFNEADYARAIDYWEDAYRRDCTANPLLLNLARAYELAGRKRQAVVSLETFLAREPSSGEKDQINRRVEVLKKKIAEEDAAAVVAPAPPPPQPASPPPVTEPAAPKAKRSPGPWIVIGVGGAAAIVGTLGVISNKKKVDDYAAQCDNPRTGAVEGRNNCDLETAKKGNDARAALNLSGVVTGVGVAAVAAGFVWLYFDGKRVANAQTQGTFRRPLVTPLLSPQLAGLNLSGAF